MRRDTAAKIESPIIKRRGPSATSPTVSSRIGIVSPDGNVFGVLADPMGRNPRGGSDPTPATVEGTSTDDLVEDVPEPQPTITNEHTNDAVR